MIKLNSRRLLTAFRIQFEIIPEIKCAAIGALTALGVKSEEIIHALAWAVRFEDAPQCRLQAANAILKLKLYHDKNVVETVRERIVIQETPEVWDNRTCMIND